MVRSLTRRPTASRALRRLRLAGLAALAAGIAYVLIGIGCFVLPHQDPLPRHADVAMVLGPVYAQRRALAMRLLRHGVVDSVQFSLGPDIRWADTDSGHAAATCRSDPRVRCAFPSPFTTQGEARMLRDGAAARIAAPVPAASPATRATSATASHSCPARSPPA